MDLHRLRVFAAVFKHRSFSKASRELFLTQPTISDHIKALEEEFGCSLFDRMGRSIIPTREAQVLYERALEILAKAAALKDMVGKCRGEVQGELIIGASTIPGTYVAPALLAAFKGKYPAVRFELIVSDSREIIDKVAAHELLLGMVGADLGNKEVRYRPFIEDELIAVASPALIAADRLSLGDFLEYPLVNRERGSGTRREFEKILQRHEISLDKLKIAGIFGSTEAVKQAVKAGLGTAILSRLSVTDEIKYHTLKEIKLPGLELRRHFYIITHKKRTLPLAYQTFLEGLEPQSPRG